MKIQLINIFLKKLIQKMNINTIHRVTIIMMAVFLTLKKMELILLYMIGKKFLIMKGLFVKKIVLIKNIIM